MNKVLIRKIGLVVFIIITLRLLTLLGTNVINLMATNYVDLVQTDTYGVDDFLDKSLKTILLEYNTEDSYTFYIESSDKKEITIIYEGGEYDYNIYIDGELRLQNDDRASGNYTSRIPYGVFDIKKADYNEVDGQYFAEIKLEKCTTKETEPIFFIGSNRLIRRFIELRTMYNTGVWICFFIILIISGILFHRDRARYMLIILVISFVSVFKAIVSGELYLFSDLIGITSHSYYFFESLTTALNYFLYQYLIYVLYEFKIKKRYLISYIFLFLVLASQYVFRERGVSFLILYLIGSIVMIIMTGIVTIKSKPYSMIILTTYSVFAGFNSYSILVIAKVLKPGYLSSVINGSQIGSIIYILGFLLAVSKTYFDKIEQYEIQQKENERIFLIRGIGHDLKLPLSVIKLNNQMLEKYDVDGEEKKAYTKISLEAVRELEKMTDNINSYLNLENTVSEGYTTNIKDSFEKLKNHYNIYNQNHYEFIVQCDERDYSLPIKSLQFDRMLYNLVDNAFKYNKDMGMVKVSYILGDYVTIIVEDTGIGMDQEEIDKIFVPFYRSDHSRRKDGLGLGMTVVIGIVKSINGEMKVESKKGIGTRIIIKVPK